LICYVSIILVSALRLQLLIHDRLPLKSVFSISAIGYFFNLFLPSGISGDMARAYYVGIETSAAKKNSTMDLVAPLLMERYFGLGSVLIIGLVALPFAVSVFDNSQLMNVIYVFVVLLVVIIFSGVSIFKLRFFRSNRFVSEFYRYVDSFQDKRRLAAVFFYSSLIQFISIFAVFLISDGMGLDISLFYFVVIIPIINIITILPVTLGGIGLREGAFVFFLAYQGIQAPAAISLSLVAFFASLAASLIGFYAYVRYKKLQPVAQ
jgi:uncharacterized membrane protein YbhN (UPF0104 family)